ncbi:MAG: hypothetical protein Aurels2KO_37160 [Aureliella sp.]
MISITTNHNEVNDGLDQTRCTRTRRQLARLLSLIDLLASFRRWHTAHEITYQLNERLEKRVSQRTVERDLDLLVSECLADSRMESPFVKFANSRTQVRTWRLLQEPTESLQEAAIQHEAAREAESEPEPLYALLIHTDELGWFESANPPKPLERWCEIVSAFAGRTSALVPVDLVDQFVKGGEAMSGDQSPTDDSDGQAIDVYTLRYTTPGGRQFFLPESMDLWTVACLARRLEASGKSPVVYRMEVNSPDVLSEGVVVPRTELQDLLSDELSLDDELSDDSYSSVDEFTSFDDHLADFSDSGHDEIASSCDSSIPAPTEQEANHV